MIDRSEAEEHLRVIRSLMEKATVYRAISAEAAAVGGSLAVAASFAFGSWWAPQSASGDFRVSVVQFTGLWCAVLAVTALTNLFFLWRAAQSRGENFISSGMRMAMRAILPSYVVAAFFTAMPFFGFTSPNLLVTAWIICHGLALLATTHFAPRSLVWLGWAFVIAGLCAILPLVDRNFAGFSLGNMAGELSGSPASRAILVGQQWMACTFGLFHLIYAACTWPRRAR